MAMVDPDLNRSQPHDDAEELLPWYATGQLDERDLDRVEAHLASCPHCRAQLTVERRLIQEFRGLVPQVESGWSRLRSRIGNPEPPFERKAGRALQALWDLLTRPAVAGLVTAQLAILVIGASVLISLSRPSYHTLGSAPPPQSANLIVIFTPDATVEEVGDTLKSQEATIVEGPTAANAYLLRVAPEKRQMILSRLQSSRDVQLAQPVDGTR